MTTRKTAATKPAPKPKAPETEPKTDAGATLVFTTETAPERAPKRRPNIYLDPIQALIDNGKVGTRQGFGFDVPTADLSKVRSRLDQAAEQLNEANDVQVSIRWIKTETDKPGVTHVVVLAVTKIRRGVRASK